MNSSEAEILESVRTIISDVTGVPPEDIAPDKRFVDDLGIDSLSMIEVVVQAQRDFDVAIPDDQLRRLATVADVVDYIRSQSTPAGGLRG